MISPMLGGPLGAAFVGLLDTYPNAAFAYSFRKLRAAYAGSAVRIRRSSDNAESDIGFTAGGDFDTSAAATHIGAGTGYIVTWYDQSGNGLDVTQSTADAQPTYAAAGLLGLPTMYYQGTVNTLSRTNVNITTYTTSPATVFVVMLEESSASSHPFSWEDTVNNRFMLAATVSGHFYWDIGDALGDGREDVTEPAGWENNPHLLEVYKTGADAQGVTVDGTNLDEDTHASDVSSASKTFWVGSYANSFLLKGYMSELVIWGTDLG